MRRYEVTSINATTYTNKANIASVNLRNIPFTDNSMYQAFYNCTNLYQVEGISNSVSNMSQAFKNCESLNSPIYISSLNITNATDCFDGGSLAKTVYIPFEVSSSYTNTYNSFVSAGYDTNGTKNGVYLADSNKPKQIRFVYGYNTTIKMIDKSDTITSTAYTGFPGFSTKDYIYLYTNPSSYKYTLTIYDINNNTYSDKYTTKLSPNPVNNYNFGKDNIAGGELEFLRDVSPSIYDNPYIVFNKFTNTEIKITPVPGSSFGGMETCAYFPKLKKALVTGNNNSRDARLYDLETNSYTAVLDSSNYTKCFFNFHDNILYFHQNSGLRKYNDISLTSYVDINPITSTGRSLVFFGNSFLEHIGSNDTGYFYDYNCNLVKQIPNISTYGMDGHGGRCSVILNSNALLLGDGTILTDKGDFFLELKQAITASQLQALIGSRKTIYTKDNRSLYGIFIIPNSYSSSDSTYEYKVFKYDFNNQQLTILDTFRAKYFSGNTDNLLTQYDEFEDIYTIVND